MPTDTPGAGTVHVTPEQLHAMAGRCTDLAESLQGRLNTVVGQVQGLSGHAFAGSANMALQNASGEIEDGMKKVFNALTGIAGKISDANVRLAGADEEIGTTITNAANTNTTVTNTLRGV